MIYSKFTHSTFIIISVANYKKLSKFSIFTKNELTN